MSTRKLATLASCSALAMILPASLLAQDGPAPMAWIYVTTVKPGTQAQYEAGLSKIIEAYNQQKSPVKWTTSVSAVGSTGTYVVSLPMQKLGDIDAWPPPLEVLTKAYDESEARKVLQSMAGAVQQSQNLVMARRPDLSHAPDPSAAQASPPTLGYVYFTTLKPGQAAQFEAAQKKIAEAYAKENSPIRWVTSMATVGASGPTYVSVIPMQKFGDLDGWQGSSPPEVLTKVYGEKEAGKILQSIAESSEGTQTSIMALRPDLSRQ
jgi:antibiotic biosynthesis monooxygenase (ABM) superfamily enzyme